MRLRKLTTAIIAAALLAGPALAGCAASDTPPTTEAGAPRYFVPSTDTASPTAEPLPDESDNTQLTPNGAVISGNQAGQVDYSATRDYIEAVVKDADGLWTKWFADLGYTGANEPWVGYKIIMPGEVYITRCGTPGVDDAITSDHPNAFYCPADMNQTDRGMLILPVQTFAKMWNGDIFTRQVDNLKLVGDFAAAAIVAHEFGHHIQDELTEVTGVLPANNPNVELIADCFAGAWTYGLFTEQRLEAGDIDEAINALGVIGDNMGSHGTNQQRQEAFKIGVYGSMADPRGGVPLNCMKAYWPQIVG